MKPRLLIITSAYKRSAQEQAYTNDFVAHYAERMTAHYEVFVLTPIDKGAAKREILNGVQVIRHRQFPIGEVGIAYGSGVMPNIRRNPMKAVIVPFFLRYLYQSILEIVQTESINVVHAHWMIPAGWIAAKVKKDHNLTYKLIVTSHGSDIAVAAKSIFKNRVEKSFEQIDVYTCVSNDLKQQANQLFPAQEIHVAPMGTDFHLFHPSKFSSLIRDEFAHEGPVLLFVGRLVKEKGIDLLIDAFLELQKDHPHASLWVVGDGNLIEELQAGCGDSNVYFFGYRDHDYCSVLFASADLFILPSESEGLGLVCMEAMASGTPCLVTDLSVFREFIEADRTGYFLRERSSLSIRTSLHELLSDLSALKATGEVARASVVEHYSWEATIARYRQLIQIDTPHNHT